MLRSEHKLSEPAPELSKKVALLNHFKTYMNDNLTKVSDFNQAYMEPNADPPCTRNMTFLVKYLRTKNGVMFRLSNQSFQVLSTHKAQPFRSYQTYIGTKWYYYYIHYQIASNDHQVAQKLGSYRESRSLGKTRLL